MRGVSWTRKFLLKRARTAYNGGRYSKALRNSRVSYFIFRGRESLDIMARSQLRLGKFESAANSYRRAEYLGFKLLDHEKNQFKSELECSNYLEAFKLINTPELVGRKKEIRALVKHLRSLTDTERVNTIEEMSEFSSLPNQIAELLPWSTKKVSHPTDINDTYTKISKHELEIERYRRELKRVKESGTFRIVKHISKAARSPLKFIKLPFSLPLLISEIVAGKRGTVNPKSEYSFQIPASSEKRECIVFFPTNGVGFGHFTRLLALAKSYRKLSPETEIVFFTTMPTLQILSDYGFIGYHMPSRYRYDKMEPSVWNPICEELLNLVFSIHRPRAFVFDGAYPYRGMLNAVQIQDEKMLKVWVRRGSIKKNSKNIPVESIGEFNVVVRPGDSGKQNFKDEFNHNIPIVRTNPILIHDSKSNSELDIRGRLGIPEFATLCYLQLGAGRINDIDSEISMTLEALNMHNHVYTIVGESMIGDRVSSPYQNVRILRDYPNSKFFHQFDFAIIAGGYNSYHEVIEYELPAICFPNMSTGRDDQLSRALVASETGAMIVLEERDSVNIGLAISRILDPAVREMMRERMTPLKKPNGATEMSLWLFDQLSS
jgi:hypothetical protein